MPENQIAGANSYEQTLTQEAKLREKTVDTEDRKRANRKQLCQIRKCDQ